MATGQTPLACPDWVWSNNSTAHVAKDKIWFGSDYIPFETEITDRFGGRVRAIGVGTVELPTKRSPNPKARGSAAHAIVRLKNVLHVPTLICNIIGNPILQDYEVDMGYGSGPNSTAGEITELDTGRRVAYFKPGERFWQPRISGPPIGPRLGPSAFKPDDEYMIHALWLPGEEERLRAIRAAKPAGSSGEPPLTAAEKEFLKMHYVDEYKFLQVYGLSIYKDEDRAEGRAMLRGFIRDEGDCDWEGLLASKDDSDSEEESEDFDPEAPLTDYLFAEDELAWIKAHYGRSMNFMLSFGLKFYKPDDCDEAQVIVKALMRDDDEDEEDDED
ncbi:hypothetical protein G7046_g7313 [Stylonectria norvegica]|nr:hypothetical protein G7046_g7313 [Stylonectria norvegica]